MFPKGGSVCLGAGAFRHMDSLPIVEPRQVQSLPSRGHIPGLPPCLDQSERIADTLSADFVHSSGMTASAHHGQVPCSAPHSLFKDVQSHEKLQCRFSSETPCPALNALPPVDAPSVLGTTPQSSSARDACRIVGGRLVRAQARGKGRAGNGHEPRPSFAMSADVDSAPTRFAAFDLAVGADVKARLPTWDADAFVRHAIVVSTVPSPIGRLLQSNVPAWPAPQAVVCLGSRFYTHVPCVLLFQDAQHVPIVVEALPWETPARLVRFAPPHLGLIQAVSCTVNGHQAQCDYRIPSDTDWIELQTAPLSADTARNIAAAFARLPRTEEPRYPPSWASAGYVPHHGFPLHVFSRVRRDLRVALWCFMKILLPLLPSCQRPFSQAVIAAVQTVLGRPEPAPRQPPGDSRSSMHVARTRHSASAAEQMPLTSMMSAPQIQSRRWGSRGTFQDFADIAQDALDGDVELTVFDAFLHVRVILCTAGELVSDPVGTALERSPYLPDGHPGRLLRYTLEGYPAPQVVLFDPARPDLRTAPVDLKGAFNRVCSNALFPFRMRLRSLSSRYALHRTAKRQPPSDFRLQGGMPGRTSMDSGLPGLRRGSSRMPMLLKSTTSNNIGLGVPADVQTLLDTERSFTPEILSPLQVRRSFTHPVSAVLVHRAGSTPRRVAYDPNLRPAALRAHVLTETGCAPDGLMKLPLLSPHYCEAMPHVCAFRRIDGHGQVPFFLAASCSR